MARRISDYELVSIVKCMDVVIVSDSGKSIMLHDVDWSKYQFNCGRQIEVPGRFLSALLNTEF